MKQEKLVFAPPKPHTGGFDHLEQVPHCVIVASAQGTVVYKNAAAQKEFPLLRKNSSLYRLVRLPLADGVLSVTQVMGYKRFVFCRRIDGGLFEIEIPGGFVMDPQQMPQAAPQMQRLLAGTRRLILSKFRMQAPLLPDPAHQALAQLLHQCLTDLSRDTPRDPSLNVCLYDLLYAVARRSRQTLEQSDTVFDFDCPKDIACQATIGPTVGILLNLICFLRLFAGQKRIFARAAKETDASHVYFQCPAKAIPDQIFHLLFGPDARVNTQHLLAAPLTMAAATCLHHGYGLTCIRRNDQLILDLALPLRRGVAQLTVIRPEGPMEQKHIEQLSTLLGAIPDLLR